MRRHDRRLALSITVVLLVAACDDVDALRGYIESDPPARTVGDYWPGLYETNDRIWPLAATSTGPVDGLAELGPGRVVWQIGPDIVETTLFSVAGFDPDTVRAARPDETALFLFVSPDVDPLPEGLCEWFECVEP